MFGFGKQGDEDVEVKAAEVEAEQPVEPAPTEQPAPEAPEQPPLAPNAEPTNEPAPPHNVTPDESPVEPPADNLPAEPVSDEGLADDADADEPAQPAEPAAEPAADAPPVLVPPDGAPDNPVVDQDVNIDNAPVDADSEDVAPEPDAELPGFGEPDAPEDQPAPEDVPVQQEPEAAPYEGPGIEPTTDEPDEVHPAEDTAGLKPSTIIPNDGPSAREFKDAVAKMREAAMELANKDTPYRGLVLEALNFAINIAGRIEGMDGPGVAGV